MKNKIWISKGILGLLWVLVAVCVATMAVVATFAPTGGLNIMAGLRTCLSMILQTTFTKMVLIIVLAIIFLAVAYLMVKLLGNGKATERQVVLFWCFILFISIIFIYGDFLLGRKFFIFNDLGADTFNQYYPLYINLAQRIREGSFSLWNWSTGLGASTVVNALLLLDPSGLFVVLLGAILGVGTIKYLVLVAQVLKIFVAFFLCRYFVKLFGYSEKICSMAGYLYALSGYLILWGQHYLLGMNSITILLILIAVEKFVRKRDVRSGVLMSVVIAFSMMWSYYASYMSLFFAAIYFFIRIFGPGSFSNIKERIAIILRCAFYVIDGILISCIVVLPSFVFLSNVSSRLGDDRGLMERVVKPFATFVGRGNFGRALVRMISNNTLYVNMPTEDYLSNYYEMPNLVFTAFAFFVVVQYIIMVFKKCKTNSQRMYSVVKIALALILLFSNGMWNAFNTFTVVTFRGTFVLFPIMALMFAETWQYCIEEKRISYVGVLLGTVLSFVVLRMGTKWANEETINNYWFYVAVFMIAFVAANIARFVDSMKKQCVVLFMLLLVVTSTFEGFCTNNICRTPVLEDTLTYNGGMVDNNTTRALERISEEDKGVYRIYKTYTDWGALGDGFMDRYSTFTTYNSVINSRIEEYYWKTYNGMHTAGAIYGMHGGIIDDEQNQASMAIINIKYILSKTELSYEWCSLLDRVGDVFIYRNEKADSIVSGYQKSQSKSNFEAATPEEKIDILNNCIIVDDDTYEKANESNAEFDIGVIEQVSERYLRGTVETSNQGFLLISVPDEIGWEVYIDGKKQNTFNADYGFLGVDISKGKHKIEVKYSIPAFAAGCGVCLLGVLLMLLNIIVQYRKRSSDAREI